jgi:hypothetical protein
MSTKIPKVVDEDTEKQRWFSAIYPWDWANCNACLTDHGFGCSNPEHRDFTQAVRAASFSHVSPSRSRMLDYRERALQLRYQFRHLYVNNPKRSLIQYMRDGWSNLFNK